MIRSVGKYNQLQSANFTVYFQCLAYISVSDGCLGCMGACHPHTHPSGHFENEFGQDNLPFVALVQMAEIIAAVFAAPV
jgi:hypothetical protein